MELIGWRKHTQMEKGVQVHAEEGVAQGSVSMGTSGTGWLLPTLLHPAPPLNPLPQVSLQAFPLGILTAHSFTSSGLLHGVFSDHFISITSLLSCLFFPALIYSQHKPLSEKQQFMSL